MITIAIWFLVKHFTIRLKEVEDEKHLALEHAQRDFIYKMGEIGETRNCETGHHVKRVAEFSELLAQLYGLEATEVELLKNASPMHDIGKVGIPDRILLKPDTLNHEEFEVMKTHTTMGYEILKDSKQSIIEAAAIIAYEHHEKWDGSGYPNGLKGEDIHIFGRITAIVDVLDALSCKRVYKEAWKKASVIEYFEEERGKHFDPQLVELFLQNFEKFVLIQEGNRDED
ncbi:MAG: HD domain-containing protein [Thiovulaceae bacterium]|nr:HD domain-containing protein [Sulfurimonadaceae bacterium]